MQCTVHYVAAAWPQYASFPLPDRPRRNYGAFAQKVRWTQIDIQLIIVMCKNSHVTDWMAFQCAKDGLHIHSMCKFVCDKLA